MIPISEKVVKTRKEHRCFACNRKYPVGTEMRSQTHDYDGIQTVYSCKTCDILMDEFRDLFIDDWENVYPGECVSERLHDFKAANAEELLEILRKHK